MLGRQLCVVGLSACTLAAIPGCVSLNSTARVSGTTGIGSSLQLESAGHTGCLPGENEITNSTVTLSGVGTWNATCKGRVYLCAAVSSGNQAFEYSCAPLAQ